MALKVQRIHLVEEMQLHVRGVPPVVPTPAAVPPEVQWFHPVEKKSWKQRPRFSPRTIGESKSLLSTTLWYGAVAPRQAACCSARVSEGYRAAA